MLSLFTMYDSLDQSMERGGCFEDHRYFRFLLMVQRWFIVMYNAHSFDSSHYNLFYDECRLVGKRKTK